jgi:SAM-dependent methyltransferase
LPWLVAKNAVFGAQRLVEFWRDWSRHVETRPIADEIDPEAHLSNVEYAENYQPTGWGVVRKLLRNLDIDYGQFTFVDLGCGKGRTMFVAAELGFRRVVGVEFSQKLTEICWSNIRRFKLYRSMIKTDITVALLDATDYEFPDDNLVVFLFNPFSYPPLLKVIDNLRQHHERYQKRIVVVYHNAKYGDILQRQPFLTQISSPAPLIHVGFKPWWPTAVFDSVGDGHAIAGGEA